MFIYNGLTNAAREGARLAIVNQDVGQVEQRVQDTSFGSTVSNIGDPADPVVAFYHEDPNSTIRRRTLSARTVVTGCIAVVTAAVDWSAITPIIGSIIGPITFTARSELPVELVCPNPKYPAYATADLCPNSHESHLADRKEHSREAIVWPPRSGGPDPRHRGVAPWWRSS